MSGIAALCLLSIGVMMTEVAILIIVIVLVHTIVDTIFVTVFINPKKSLMIMDGFLHLFQLRNLQPTCFFGSILFKSL